MLLFLIAFAFVLLISLQTTINLSSSPISTPLPIFSRFHRMLFMQTTTCRYVVVSTLWPLIFFFVTDVKGSLLGLPLLKYDGSVIPLTPKYDGGVAPLTPNTWIALIFVGLYNPYLKVIFFQTCFLLVIGFCSCGCRGSWSCYCCTHRLSPSNVVS